MKQWHAGRTNHIKRLPKPEKRVFCLTTTKTLVNNVSYRNDHGYEFFDQKQKRKVIEAKKFIRKFNMSTEKLALNINII